MNKEHNRREGCWHRIVLLMSGILMTSGCLSIPLEQSHREMERYNKDGAPALDRLPSPAPMTPAAVEQAAKDGAVLVDLRSPEAIAGAFIPGSLAIPLDMLPAYAGYLLGYDHDLVLVHEDREQVPLAVRYLIRMGYERIHGYLKGGMHAWEISGREYDRIGAVHANTLKARLNESMKACELVGCSIEEG